MKLCSSYLLLHQNYAALIKHSITVFEITFISKPVVVGNIFLKDELESVTVNGIQNLMRNI